MSRLPLIPVGEMTQEQHAQYDRFPSNLTRTLLLLDGRLAGALPNLANALRASSLDARFREAVILRVAALQGSAYERMQHLGQARKVGWSDEEIAAIESGEDAINDPRLKTVLAFVDACVAHAEVSDQTFAAASGVLSHRDLATVIVLVGHYKAVSLSKLFGLPRIAILDLSFILIRRGSIPGEQVGKARASMHP